MNLNNRLSDFIYSEEYSKFLIGYEDKRKRVYQAFLQFHNAPSRGGFERLKREMISKVLYADLPFSSVFVDLTRKVTISLKGKESVILNADSPYEIMTSEILEIIYPNSFMIYRKEIMSILGFYATDYLDYLEKCRKIISKHSTYLNDFLDLHLFLIHEFPEYWEGDKNNNAAIDVYPEISALRGMSFLNIDIERIAEFRQHFKSMDRNERKKRLRLYRSEGISSYILNVIREDEIQGLVIDGSNVAYIFSRPGSPRMDSLRRVLSQVERNDTPVFYPVYVVFDKSLKYRFRGYERNRFEHEFLMNPFIIEVEHADPFILNFARTYRLAVLSNDRFLEWDTNNIAFYHISKDGVIEECER